MRLDEAFVTRPGSMDTKTDAESKDGAKDTPALFKELAGCTSSLNCYYALFQVIIADAASGELSLCPEDMDSQLYGDLGFLNKEAAKMFSFQLENDSEFKDRLIKDKQRAIHEAAQFYGKLGLGDVSAETKNDENQDQALAKLKETAAKLGLAFQAIKPAQLHLEGNDLAAARTWLAGRKAASQDELNVIKAQQEQLDGIDATILSLHEAYSEDFDSMDALRDLCYRLKNVADQALATLPLQIGIPGQKDPFQAFLFPFSDLDEMNDQRKSNDPDVFPEAGSTRIQWPYDIPTSRRPIFRFARGSGSFEFQPYNVDDGKFYFTEGPDGVRLAPNPKAVDLAFASTKSRISSRTQRLTSLKPSGRDDPRGDKTMFKGGDWRKRVKRGHQPATLTPAKQSESIVKNNLRVLKKYTDLLKNIDSLTKFQGLVSRDRKAFIENLFPGMHKGKLHKKLGIMAVHSCDAEGNVNLECIITWRLGGGGHGIGRADDVNDDCYVWEYEGNQPAIGPRLGEILGLSIERRLKSLEKTYTVLTGSLGQAQDDKIAPSNYAYELRFLKPREGNGELECYVAVNLPSPDERTGPAWQIFGNPVEAGAFKFLNVLHFKYYRRIRMDRKKVLRAAASKKNPPRYAESYTDGYKKYVGLNLPIRLAILQNYRLFRGGKSTRAVLKNKGENLFLERAVKRLNAGTVMKDLLDAVGKDAGALKKSTKSGLSATKFADFILSSGDDKTRTDWRTLKQTDLLRLPTLQEWCHLKGHGDGGVEEVGNFASGSFHCNTEQLAIELGQRHTTNLPETKGKRTRQYQYMLKSSAYLLADSSMNPQADYLKADADYEKRSSRKNTKKTGKETTTEKDDLARLKRNAPVAAFIRYKVFQSDKADADARVKARKIFDYVFEGQGEFFDKNQFQLLTTFVRFLVSAADAQWNDNEFTSWFNQKDRELTAHEKEAKASKA